MNELAQTADMCRIASLNARLRRAGTAHKEEWRSTMTIKLGDYVILKSGGPHMIVDYIRHGGTATRHIVEQRQLPPTVDDPAFTKCTVTTNQDPVSLTESTLPHTQISCVWWIDGKFHRRTFSHAALGKPTDGIKSN